ncbi:MAG: ligand-binding sensor domain-containing protein [Vicingaceae bacterium]
MILLLCKSSYTQTYNFEYFNVTEGLSQSKVTSIIEDKRGYLWVGTSGGGICKFDGKNFEQYSEKDGLSGNIVTDLNKDNDGNIWATSTWGGISRFDGKSFYSFAHKEGFKKFEQLNVVFSDSKNKIWIGSKIGITTYENNKFVHLKELNDAIIYEIIEDSKGNIWVGTNKGIAIITPTKTIQLSKKNGLLSNNVKAILEDANGNFIVGTSEGLTQINTTNNSFKVINKKFKGLNANVTAIISDKENNVWISTRNSGAYILNKKGIITHISKKNGLLTNNLTTLFLDKSGNLWIGSNGAGLIKYANKAFTSFNKVDGLNNNEIYSFVKDTKNNIWVSTAGEGVFKFDGKQSTQYTTKNKLGSNKVRSSLLDHKGNLWFATSKGLTRYKDGIFKNFTTLNGLSSNKIRTLMLDHNNNLWIGTSGGGLLKYDYKTFTNYTQEDGLSHNFIHTLFEDSKNNIWIGTGNGVNKYKNGSFTSYAREKGFCNSYISSISEDKFGTIWFGTDRCAVRYDGSEFTPIGTKDGLASGTIYLMHSDKKGNLWIGTNKGLDRIQFDSYGQISRIKNYKAKQGFKGVECNTGAVFEDKLGNIWFATVKGAIKYNPKQDKTNVFQPSIHINNVKLFFNDVDWTMRAKSLHKWNNLPKDLQLSYKENHLTFEYSAVNLTFPENVQYRFKLTPFDTEWYSPTEKTIATYSNLPPGTYTFSVKARNEDGLWNQTPASYSFTIASPWFKKWWFIAIVFITFAFIIYKVSTFKEQQQRQISKELEKKVKERTALIETQHDEKEILLKEIHHRVKNNMQVIISLISIQSGYTQDKVALSLFEEAKNRIRSMALIHEKMYQTGDLAYIDVQDYIMALTNDLIDTYAINSDIFLDIKIEKEKFSIDTLIPLGLLMNEIISNALKYAFTETNKGKIFIHLNFDDKKQEYSLIIGDDGVGMPIGNLEIEDGTLGMELIKIFVSQIDGEISRREEKGTSYEINFPALG